MAKYILSDLKTLCVVCKARKKMPNSSFCDEICRQKNFKQQDDKQAAREKARQEKRRDKKECPICGNLINILNYCKRGCHLKEGYTFTHTCAQCGKQIDLSTRKDKFSLMCSDECEVKYQHEWEKIEQSIYNVKCSTCGQEFRKTSNTKQRTCGTCKNENNVLCLKKLTEIKRLDVKNKEKRKGISLEELNRREEWKRVFDEAFAERWIKGKC